MAVEEIYEPYEDVGTIVYRNNNLNRNHKQEQLLRRL